MVYAEQQQKIDQNQLESDPLMMAESAIVGGAKAGVAGAKAGFKKGGAAGIKAGKAGFAIGGVKGGKKGKWIDQYEFNVNCDYVFFFK